MGLIDPENAVKLGYLDGFKTIDETLKEKYDGLKVLAGSTRSPRRFGGAFVNFLSQ